MPLSRCVAMDCEMVGAGPRGRYEMLARVSIVDEYDNTVLDVYVQPTQRVTDYRTWVSGIRPDDLEDGQDFYDVRDQVRRILKRRVVVGHALAHDFRALELNHPPSMIRDTAKYPPFIRMNGNRTPSLRWLANRLLGWSIQRGEHCSLEDAVAAMNIYHQVQRDWEAYVAKVYHCYGQPSRTARLGGLYANLPSGTARLGGIFR